MLQARKGFPIPEPINPREWEEITPADARSLLASGKDIIVEGYLPKYWEYPAEVAWAIRVNGVMDYRPTFYLEVDDALSTPFTREDVIWRFFKRVKAK